MEFALVSLTYYKIGLYDWNERHCHLQELIVSIRANKGEPIAGESCLLAFCSECDDIK